MDSRAKKMPLKTCVAVAKLMTNKNTIGILALSSYTVSKTSSPTSMISPLKKRMAIKTNMPTDTNDLMPPLF
jgi:hypothetical protein